MERGGGRADSKAVFVSDSVLLVRWVCSGRTESPKNTYKYVLTYGLQVGDAIVESCLHLCDGHDMGGGQVPLLGVWIATVAMR